MAAARAGLLPATEARRSCGASAGMICNAGSGLKFCRLPGCSWCDSLVQARGLAEIVLARQLGLGPISVDFVGLAGSRPSVFLCLGAIYEAQVDKACLLPLYHMLHGSRGIFSTINPPLLSAMLYAAGH